MTTKQPTVETPIDDNVEEEVDEYVIIPPDGGFGWVVAFAAMLCNLVCDGTLFAFGTMKIYLQQYFQCSDMLILMVGSVPCGVYLLVGPIVSGLANKYGCRPIIIIGSIGAATCMALSTLSSNVWMMMVIYGVVGGIFFGMVYLPSVVMVSFYFEKKRAIANGLVTAGTGIGALSFGPLANFLMKRLGWKTGMLIFAGIMLSCVLFGAIMRPLQPTKVKRRVPKRTSRSANEKRSDQLATTLPTLDEVPGETTVALLSSSDPYDTIPEATISGPSSPSATRTCARESTISVDDTREGVPDPENASRPLYKKDAFFSGSKDELRRLSCASTHSHPYMSTVTADDKHKKQSTFKAFGDILLAMTDFSILKNQQMLLICIGNIFSMLGYYLPIMCLVSFAVEDNHVDATAASFLLTIFGFFNTIGRFVSGPIAMIPGLGPLKVHNALLYMAGILTVLAAYAHNFTTCALYAGLCGFAIAPHMSLMPSIILDCVGLDKFTTAFGILFLFRGATSIIGPPLAGFLKDYTKNYDISFVVGGAMIVIGAFFHFAIACVRPERKEREEIDA